MGIDSEGNWTAPSPVMVLGNETNALHTQRWHNRDVASFDGFLAFSKQKIQKWGWGGLGGFHKRQGLYLIVLALNKDESHEALEKGCGLFLLCCEPRSISESITHLSGGRGSRVSLTSSQGFDKAVSGKMLKDRNTMFG